MPEHQNFMDIALDLARTAMKEGDWPVAAVIAREGKVVGQGRGRQSTAGDPTAHAELDALRDARDRGETVAGSTLYCTMEPCPMCAWALRLSGIDHIVLGARHKDLGRTDLGTYSIERFADLMGAAVELTTGVRQGECVALRREWGRDKTL